MSDIANPPDLPRKPSTEASRAWGTIWRRARRGAGLTVGDVAELLGCTLSRASDIEIGEETPTEHEAIAFARALAARAWRGAR